MKNFLKIADKIDVGPLLYAIVRQPNLWNQFDIRKTFNEHSVHKTADDILLRYPKYEAGEDVTARCAIELENVDYPAFARLPEARSLIFPLMFRLQGERLGKALIARLAPGAKIAPHSDVMQHKQGETPFAVYYDRYHIVLKSQPGVVFRCGDEQVYMGAGEVWWFDNTKEHEVINNSNDDRIHLIMDIKCSSDFWTPPA